MTVALKIGDRTFSGGDVISQLKQYGLLPSLVRELVLESAIENWCQENPEAWSPADEEQIIQQVKTQQALQAMAPQKGPPAEGEGVEQMAIKRAKLERFKEGLWGNKVESYFLQRKARLDRVIYSLLRLKDAAIAQELYFRLESEEAVFTDLAAKYSQGPEANTGGLIGPADLGGCHPRLSEMMRVSQPGQLWPPTRVEDWWVIIRLEKFMPAQIDEAMRRRLLEEMFVTWLKEESQKFEVVEATPAQTSLPEPSPTASLALPLPGEMGEMGEMKAAGEAATQSTSAKPSVSIKPSQKPSQKPSDAATDNMKSAEVTSPWS